MSYVMKCDQCYEAFSGTYFGIKSELDAQSMEFRMTIKKCDMRNAGYHDKHYCSWQCASEEAKNLTYEGTAKL